MSLFDGIVFDLDGVIIDSEPLHEKAIIQVCAQYGVSLSPAMLGPFKGKTDKDVFAYILQVYAPAGATLDALLDGKRKAYTALLPELEPISGALDCITALHAHPFRLGLTTSASARNQALAFDRFGLSPYFEVVTTAADVQRPKPHPEPYLITTARLSLPPARVLVIEDSIHGVKSGKAAGCQVAAITSSFDATALQSAGADFVFTPYADLLRWVSSS